MERQPIRTGLPPRPVESAEHRAHRLARQRQYRADIISGARVVMPRVRKTEEEKKLSRQAYSRARNAECAALRAAAHLRGMGLVSGGGAQGYYGGRRHRR